MKKPSVYVETSVISYMVAPLSRDLLVAAHQQVTVEWWRLVLPECRAFVSPFVVEEIAEGDPEQAKRRLAIVAGFPALEVTREVRNLAELYFREIEIPERAKTDAFHLAVATFYEMDYLTTWNCRHIASGRVRSILERVNGEKRIATPIICTPEELMEV